MVHLWILPALPLHQNSHFPNIHQTNFVSLSEVSGHVLLHYRKCFVENFFGGYLRYQRLVVVALALLGLLFLMSSLFATVQQGPGQQGDYLNQSDTAEGSSGLASGAGNVPMLMTSVPAILQLDQG